MIGQRLGLRRRPLPCGDGMKRPCPGCFVELVERGRCKACQPKSAAARFDQTRGSSWARGYDGTWTALRRAFLAEHPLCADIYRLHGERPVLAEEVDHIMPFYGKKDAKRLEWDNLQALCKACHSRKTATEDSAFARRLGPVG